MRASTSSQPSPVSAEHSTVVPFIVGSEPTEKAPCATGLGGSIKRWFRGLFE